MNPNVPDLSKLAAIAVPLDKKKEAPQMNAGVPAHKVQVTGGQMNAPGIGEVPIAVFNIGSPAGAFYFYMPAENAKAFGEAIVKTAKGLLPEDGS